MIHSLHWRHYLGACALIFATAAGSFAEAKITSEQRRYAKDLPQTVVVRVKKGTHRVEVAQLKNKLSPNSQSKKMAAKAHFSKVGKSGKLDRGNVNPLWFWSWDFSCDEYYRYDSRYERSRYYDEDDDHYYQRYNYSYDSDDWYYSPSYRYNNYDYRYGRYYGYSDGNYDYYFYGWWF